MGALRLPGSSFLPEKGLLGVPKTRISGGGKRSVAKLLSVGSDDVKTFSNAGVSPASRPQLLKAQKKQCRQTA
jgi:hypothetical protein